MQAGLDIFTLLVLNMSKRNAAINKPLIVHLDQPKFLRYTAGAELLAFIKKPPQPVPYNIDHAQKNHWHWLKIQKPHW